MRRHFSLHSEKKFREIKDLPASFKERSPPQRGGVWGGGVLVWGGGGVGEERGRSLNMGRSEVSYFPKRSNRASVYRKVFGRGKRGQFIHISSKKGSKR